MSTDLQLITTTSAHNVNTLSITDCFTSAYDVYKIVASIPEYIPTDTNVVDFRVQFIDSSGSVISGSEYGTARLQLKGETSNDDDKIASSTYMYGALLVGNYDSGGMVGYVYNPNDSSCYTQMISQGVGGYDTSSNRFRATRQIGVHKSAEQITGIHFLSSSGSLNIDVRISIYGVKK
jgi:hypothetical protein